MTVTTRLSSRSRETFGSFLLANYDERQEEVSLLTHSDKHTVGEYFECVLRGEPMRWESRRASPSFEGEVTVL